VAGYVVQPGRIVGIGPQRAAAWCYYLRKRGGNGSLTTEDAAAPASPWKRIGARMNLCIA